MGRGRLSSSFQCRLGLSGGRAARRVPTCEVAELRDEHGRARQAAPGAPPPLGLTHQHRLFQVGDFLVILLFERRKASLLTVKAFGNTSVGKTVSCVNSD